MRAATANLMLLFAAWGFVGCAASAARDGAAPHVSSSAHAPEPEAPLASHPARWVVLAPEPGQAPGPNATLNPEPADAGHSTVVLDGPDYFFVERTASGLVLRTAPLGERAATSHPLPAVQCDRSKLAVRGQQMLFACDRLFASADRGKTWKDTALSLPGLIFDMSITGGRAVVTVGPDWSALERDVWLLKNEQGTWTAAKSTMPEGSAAFRIRQSADGARVYAVGGRPNEASFLLLSTDGGRSFQERPIDASGVFDGKARWDVLSLSVTGSDVGVLLRNVELDCTDGRDCRRGVYLRLGENLERKSGVQWEQPGSPVAVGAHLAEGDDSPYLSVSNDWGKTWKVVAIPDRRRGRVVCGEAGCIIGDSVSRVGWE
ncbi:MAG: hypothetical protein HOW73_27330 [Polyangiaceae bacterium]|nr:hypothetical protein [Polyangiaceae bacterium]